MELCLEELDLLEAPYHSEADVSERTAGIIAGIAFVAGVALGAAIVT